MKNLLLCSIILLSTTSIFAEKWAQPIENCAEAKKELSQMQATRFIKDPGASWHNRMLELQDYVRTNNCSNN